MEKDQSVQEQIENARDTESNFHAQNHGLDTVDPSEAKRVLRKIDFFLMPLLMVTFMLQYMDKVILSGAAQFGIIEDLKLYTVISPPAGHHDPELNLNRFSNVTLIFYWGCLAGLIPASWLAQRLPVGRYLAGTVVVWGFVATLSVLCKSYNGFLVLRFFQGATECAVAPGFSIVIAMWWNRTEQPLRYALWYTSTGLGGLVGSLAIFGIGHIQGSLRPWKYQFLILGAVTVAWGIILVFLLPDHPRSARFLKPHEREIAVERMRADHIGIEDKTFKFHQIKDLLTDPKIWILVPATFCLHFVNGGVSGFGTVIISSFGYSSLDSVLLTGAVGGGVFVTCIVIGLVGTLKKDFRTWLIIFGEVTVVIGATMVWKLDWKTQRAGAIVGFVMCGWFAGGYMMLLALVSANIAGHTKKTFASALIWCAWGVSNGVAPLTVKTTEESEHYPSCFAAVIATGAATIAAILGLRVYLVLENKRRDQEHGPVDPVAALQLAFEDLTDRENMQFRYSL
ncbi:hypothetical protein FE257_000143 [Aspergillus nanangensis]|uniref:Major facilitator superfamily (MFS) profile domain-containing protein n=1 Tax=Aspergillus nanangensis TaxID=2582783 RepID=A0AAD4GZR6_ASPNN|nr:hypothetical protein FE257_000143 [Aspergillus nanangensis]